MTGGNGKGEKRGKWEKEGGEGEGKRRRFPSVSQFQIYHYTTEPMVSVGIDCIITNTVQTLFRFVIILFASNELSGNYFGQIVHTRVYV